MRLNSYNLEHAPTIGDMYEGLSRDLLGRAIPEALKLQIVSGFITDDTDGISGQIDCMLVRGNGIRIPYTSDYKWHVKDVIAVLEIKKSLRGTELSDAFDHLQIVRKLESNYFSSFSGQEAIDIGSAERAFAVLTGKVSPGYSGLSDLTLQDQLLFHTLVIEQYSVIRIVLGYNGFKTEYGFRESLLRFLKQKIANSSGPAFGAGANSFPQLIVSGRYSLCKANGQPFMAMLHDGKWPFYMSSSANPLELMLEYIWTRLSHEFKIGGLWGEDLTDPKFNPYLLATVQEKDGNVGWAYEYHRIDTKTLSVTADSIEWEPIPLSAEQFAIISLLGGGKPVRIDDDEVASWLLEAGIDVEQFVTELIATGLVAVAGNELELTTEQIMPVILPGGQFVAGEDNTGRMTRWLKRYISNHDTIE